MNQRKLDTKNSKEGFVIVAPLLPSTGYLRLSQIIGDPRSNLSVHPIIPISKSSWWAGIKSGIYPKPVKLGSRITAWKVEDIRELLTKLGES